MKNTLKWKRAGIIYPTDHIISSKARELGTCYGFIPPYENVEHVNMRFIVSNEYMRLWFKERDLYQKENYAKQEKTRNDVNLRRGYVQRMMTNNKLLNRELPIIQLKRFQDIISKVDTRRTLEEKTKICERYKKSLQPTILTRYKPACATSKQKSSSRADENKIESKQKGAQEDDDSMSTKQTGSESNKLGKLKEKCVPLVCKLI